MSRKTKTEKRRQLRLSPPGRGVYATIYTLILLLAIVCGLTITEVCSGWSAYSLIDDHHLPPPTADGTPDHAQASHLGAIVEQIEAAERGRVFLQRRDSVSERSLSDRESKVTY